MMNCVDFQRHWRGVHDASGDTVWNSVGFVDEYRHPCMYGGWVFDLVLHTTEEGEKI